MRGYGFILPYREAAAATSRLRREPRPGGVRDNARKGGLPRPLARRPVRRSGSDEGEGFDGRCDPHSRARDWREHRHVHVPGPASVRAVAGSEAFAVAVGFLFGLRAVPGRRPLQDGCRYDAYVYLRDRNQAFSGLAATMVAGAAVFIRSFRNLRSVPVGFSPVHVSAITLASANDDPETIKAPFREAALLAESLRGAPGVESATVADLLTFSDSRISFSLTVPGDPAQPKRTPNLLRVDGSYFDALRIPLIACRAFSAHDDRHAPKVAILSDGTARRLFGGQSPLGRRILNRTSQVIAHPLSDVRGSESAPS